MNNKIFYLLISLSILNLTSNAFGMEKPKRSRAKKKKVFHAAKSEFDLFSRVEYISENSDLEPEISSKYLDVLVESLQFDNRVLIDDLIANIKRKLSEILDYESTNSSQDKLNNQLVDMLKSNEDWVIDDIFELIVAGANPNILIESEEDEKGTPLLFKINERDFRTAPVLLPLLIIYGLNPNCSSPNGTTALMFATIDPNLNNSIQMLIHLGADVNAKDEEMRTPLMLATMVNNLKAVKLLLKQDASSINAIESINYTALTYAILFGRNEIAHILLENGADLQQGNSLSIFMLHHGNNPQISKLILERYPELKSEAQKSIEFYARAKSTTQIATPIYSSPQYPTRSTIINMSKEEEESTAIDMSREEPEEKEE